MSDHILRLPNTVFTAVLDLGDPRATFPVFPDDLPVPALVADVDEESNLLTIEIVWPDGELHYDYDGATVEYHFHTAGGDASQSSPWPADVTTRILEWTRLFAGHVFTHFESIADQIESAAEWHDRGLPVFAVAGEPRVLEVLDVELEGDALTLPWLGAGTVGHEHNDDEPGDPITLLWDPAGVNPHIPIAKAHMDDAADEVRSVILPGVDLAAVGLEEHEVCAYLEGLYINDNLVADPRDVVYDAAILRIAGLW